MKQKTQIVLIHGGGTYKSREEYFKALKKQKVSLDKWAGWFKDYFDKKLGKDFEIIRLKMPLADDARYEEWKVYFKKYLPFLRDNMILIGYSLGAIFLAKYLSENKFPKKILATYLVAVPFDGSMLKDSDATGGFVLKPDLSLIQKNSPNLNLFFSKDDDIVPVSHAEKYREDLPGANIIIYKSKNGHFLVPEFPEIIKMIKGNLK